MDWDLIWRLPGPASFVRDVASSLQSGRHTVALLPSWLHEEDPTDSLVDAVTAELSTTARAFRLSRLRPAHQGGTLAQALGEELAWGTETTPTTLDEWLTHESAVGNLVSVVANDLEAQHISELPEFVRRVSQASRPLSSEDRLTLLVIGSRHQLLTPRQPDIADVTINVVWFWNRLARWDLAALLAAQDDSSFSAGLAHEIRMESVVEVARWRVPLALQLWSNWSGEPGDLPNFMAIHDQSPPPAPPRSAPGPHPPTTWLEHWDLGLAEGWHGIMAVHPMAVTGPAGAPQRWIWLAQARVLLPWIEERRVKVYDRVREKLGEGFGEVLSDARLWSPHDEALGDVLLEIKDLAWIIRQHLWRESDLKEAANSLWKARNEIAHLRPLSSSHLRSMADTCRHLG